MAEYDFTKLDWTASSKKDDCPAVILTGGRLEGSQLKNSIRGAINAITAGAGNTDYIDNLYKLQGESGGGTKTFRLPFFNTTYNSFTNQFADAFSQISQRGNNIWGADIADSVNNIAANIRTGMSQSWEFLRSFAYLGPTNGPPGTYIQTPMFWQAANTAQPLIVKFVLSNTVSEDGAEKNLAAINQFAKANKAKRDGGGIKIDYPMVYQIELPGHRYMRWGYCSSFNVGMLGLRKAKGESKTPVPEAYSCEFGFTSLTLEDADMLTGTIK